MLLPLLAVLVVSDGIAGVEHPPPEQASAEKRVTLGTPVHERGNPDSVTLLGPTSWEKRGVKWWPTDNWTPPGSTEFNIWERSNGTGLIRSAQSDCDLTLGWGDETYQLSQRRTGLCVANLTEAELDAIVEQPDANTDSDTSDNEPQSAEANSTTERRPVYDSYSVCMADRSSKQVTYQVEVGGTITLWGPMERSIPCTCAYSDGSVGSYSVGYRQWFYLPYFYERDRNVRSGWPCSAPFSVSDS